MTHVEAQPELVEAVREELARESRPITAHHVAEVIRRSGRPVGDAQVLAVHEVLRRTAFGVGVLEPLVRDPSVTDVLANGPGPVWVDRGAGLEPTQVHLADEGEVRRLAQRLAALGGRRLDDATPCCDVRLPDGTRFHAVLAPVARPGTLISLRVPRTRAFTLEELIAARTVSPAGAGLLREVVERRLAFLISGGTGSGKTTLLATLLGLVATDERIVLVEDSSELRPDHPHVVALEARPPNIEGMGGLDLRTLVRQALRMRPDRLVVGEVRGAEVVDLLAALNTGHEGGAGTLHANTAGQVVARIEALAATAGLDRAAALSQLSAAVDLVLHVVRDRDGVRRLAQVGVPVPGPSGVRILPAVEFTATGESREGPAASALADRLGW